MKGHWEFNQTDPSNVRVEVTQRDQFNNDEVGLAEALVREVIQNSLDAKLDSGPVKVRFSIKTLSGADAAFLATQLAPLTPHLAACGVDCSPLSKDAFRLLTVEDFNTTGLEGRFDEIDAGNFDIFWRAVGDSTKKGNEGGRWGLGKLVYSSSSELKAFYGLTISKDNCRPSLMAQVVLRNHRIGDRFHPSHGFWFSERSESLGLQLPVQDEVEIASFAQLAGIIRTDQTGLSLVVPFLVDAVDEEAVISGVISNYYFPILAGKLEVEVGNLVINRESFTEIAANDPMSDQIPFGFVRDVSDRMLAQQDFVSTSQLGNAELDETSFAPEIISAMKSRFSAGDMVSMRVPVALKPKSGVDVSSYVDLYLQALPEGAKPFALIARGPLTLPGERRSFGNAMAYGALIASDDSACAFLGDAENPAHTAWNANAEKLRANWRSPQATLASIRHALRNLYLLIADQAESEDAEALIDFFSILEKSNSSSGRKRRISKPLIDIPAREKAISIRGRKGGFEIIAGPGAASWTYPRNIRVRVAYDMIGANPFSRHSRFDFDLSSDSDIEFDATSADYEVVKPNVLKVTVQASDFCLQVSGFDQHRDLVVDVRAQ
ncbi:MAG: hypothetical protein KKC03_13430 [Bacteroidetes bacterium]|nr:hypothetical protein [Bacteroidota bacterium]